VTRRDRGDTAADPAVRKQGRTRRTSLGAFVLAQRWDMALGLEQPPF